MTTSVDDRYWLFGWWSCRAVDNGQGVSRTWGTAGIVSDMSDTPGRPQTGLTISQRIAAMTGRPAPRPLTDAERDELERLQDEADAGAERLYGIRGAAA